MLLNKNIDKETVRILMQENKRLKRENQRLNESLDELQEYKEEYRALIGELSQMKENYVKKMAEFDKTGNAYKAELDRLTRKRGLMV